LLCLTPIICMIAAIKSAVTPAAKGGSSVKGDFVSRVAAAFSEQLLCPQDWFSYWRLNCRLATWHSSVCSTQDKKGYTLEDKWLFLQEAEKQGVPVSPSLRLPGIVVKHRNEEGGMGFQSFRNAADGGDWCIQARLSNSPFLRSLLPPNAPLSTFRVITSSTGGMRGSADAAPVVRALSCVWRAGRAGAATDHQSILFDVDMTSGEILKGTTSAHWYRLGLSKALSTPWLSTHDIEHHPDTQQKLVGKRVPNMPDLVRLVTDAHKKLCPTVPLVGWDVALTEKNGSLLLEGNFSCNFFRGHFDKPAYFSYVEDFFTYLEDADRKAAVPSSA